MDILYFKILPAGRETTDKTSTRIKLRAIFKEKNQNSAWRRKILRSVSFLYAFRLIFSSAKYFRWPLRSLWPRANMINRQLAAM